MGDPSDQEIGANLAELYLKGRDTLPGVAAEIGAAQSSFGGADTWDPFLRPGGDIYENNPTVPFGHGFGGAVNGPGDDLAAAISLLGGHLTSLKAVLDDCGPNIILTAQDYARTDADVQAAFLAMGGTL